MTIATNKYFKIKNGLQFDDGTSQTTAFTTATQVVSLAELKTWVSTATNFANFQSIIAGI
jgi:hypothetical protein